MEETQNQSQGFSQDTPQQDKGVSFPTVGEQNKGGGAKTLLIIGILALIGILGYVIYRSASEEGTGELAEPTPYENTAVPVEEPTPVPSSSPSASPSATADKTKVKIQVQNGTGITGEAAYLQNILKAMGYTNVTVGNSPTQDETETTVSFASSVSSDMVSEITSKLNATYQTVTKTSSTSTSYDVVIVTGLRKGATAKPSASPTATP